MSAAFDLRRFRHGETDSAAFDVLAGPVPEPVPAGTDCLVAERAGAPVGRCSLQAAQSLHGTEGPTGMIGHFEARDLEAAVAVLEAAVADLGERGLRHVLGPINGSTWARYRLALPREAEEQGFDPPVFAGEPTNPDAYPAYFTAAGAAIAARYESRIDATPGEPADDADALAARARDAGFRVRPLELARFEAELTTLYELSLASFAGNLFYSPIGWLAFREQYERLRGLLDPELVLIAEAGDGAPVAFQFAYVDPMCTATGRPPRAIVKTVATLPAARGMGMAGHMLDLLRERAAARGATSVIHALMHVANFSMKMSSRHRTRVFRRYALYEWRQ